MDSFNRKLNRKLEESYQHIKPYISKEETPELYDMCQCCEKWNGSIHNYEECRNMQCFKNWLGYAYLKWSTSWE